MIFAVICLTWCGIKLSAPIWYYVLLVLWLIVRAYKGSPNNN